MTLRVMAAALPRILLSVQEEYGDDETGSDQFS
jgi:hypothetical protein